MRNLAARRIETFLPEPLNAQAVTLFVIFHNGMIHIMLGCYYYYGLLL